MNRAWTKEEIEYLENNWGSTAKKIIAKELNRTEIAIYRKSRKLKLGAEFQNHLTFKEVGDLVGIDGHTVAANWVKKGLKYTKQGRLHYVSIYGLTKFLKENQDLWNSEHLEPFILGKEEEWLKEKRKRDTELKVKNSNRKWTKEEDKRLMLLSKTHSQAEIGKLMNRSQLSVRARVRSLRAKKKIKPSGNVAWKPIEDEIIIRMDKEGKSDNEIAYELGRERINVANRRWILKNKNKYPRHHKSKMRVKEVANG